VDRALERIEGVRLATGNGDLHRLVVRRRTGPWDTKQDAGHGRDGFGLLVVDGSRCWPGRPRAPDRWRDVHSSLIAPLGGKPCPPGVPRGRARATRQRRCLDSACRPGDKAYASRLWEPPGARGKLLKPVSLPPRAGESSRLRGCAGRFMPLRIPGRIAIPGGEPSVATPTNTRTASEFHASPATRRKMHSFLRRPTTGEAQVARMHSPGPQATRRWELLLSLLPRALARNDETRAVARVPEHRGARI
jgi:hypothetical protein